MFGTFDIECAGYQITAGGIGHGHDGQIFRCTLSPVAEDVFGKLLAASRQGALIRLVFTQQPLLLERVEIVRIDASCIRIVGHVIDGAKKRP
jgi:hypothetical protein